MAINIRSDLKTRNELITNSIAAIENKIEQLPEGRINVRYRNGNCYFYLYRPDSPEKYLGPEEMELVENLIQKDYLKRVLKDVKRELSAIERMQKIYPEAVAEDVYDQLPEALKKYAKPINLCDDEYAIKWMETPYRHKPFKNDAPVFVTTKGERVRSKSEVIIADRLRANGIPYRYECPLKVGKKIIHPDFTILRMSDRSILYHEHCGKMGDQKYVEDMLVRQKDYNEAGIILGDRLFYTFESDTVPLDVTILDNIINQHFR